MHGSYTDTDGYSVAMMREKGYQAVIEKYICKSGKWKRPGAVEIV